MFRKKAFTLIELLVVISIIALLVSILMPALGNAKKQAKAVVCQSNLSQWSKMFLTYTLDNNDIFMEGWFGDGNDRDGQWMYALRDYMDNDHSIWCCPIASDENKTQTDKEGISTGLFGVDVAWGYLNTNAHGGYDNDLLDYGSYGINSYVYNVPRDTWGVSKEDYWKKTTVGSQANNIPMFFDAMWCEVWPKMNDVAPTFSGARESSLGMPWCTINRHSGYINAAFLDASVRKVGLKELWLLKWNRIWRPYDIVEPNWPVWMDGFEDHSYR